MARSPHPGERRRSTRRAARYVACAIGILTLVVAVAAPTLAVPRADEDRDAEAAAGAVEFLRSQQQADGGFGPGALTPDSAAAIAQQAQTGATWSTKEAVDAVAAVESDEGTTPLDALDALASDAAPDLAAQLISRAVVPMGLDPENFDPAGDGDPVDLVRDVAVGRRQDGSFGSVAATAEAVIALVMVGRPVNERTPAFLEAAQQENGGWNADGDPAGEFVDPATTGLVVEALVAAGVAPTGDTSAGRGLAFLADTQKADGGWPVEARGRTDAIATSWAMGAIRSAGYDPAEGCWRDATGVTPADDTYVSPAEAVVAEQGDDGAIAGGLDPVASTALGAQALLGNWLPTTRAEAVDCTPEAGGLGIRPSLVVLVVIALVMVVGAVTIMRRSNA